MRIIAAIGLAICLTIVGVSCYKIKTVVKSAADAVVDLVTVEKEKPEEEEDVSNRVGGSGDADSDVVEEEEPEGTPAYYTLLVTAGVVAIGLGITWLLWRHDE